MDERRLACRGTTEIRVRAPSGRARSDHGWRSRLLRHARVLHRQIVTPERDLAVPVYVIDRVRVEGYGAPNCLPLPFQLDNTYEALLLAHVENQWISSATSESPTPAYTLKEAIDTEVQ